MASANKLVDGTMKRAGTYLLHTYLIETNGCCVDGKITFANQQVLEEGHSRLHEKGSDDMDCPCRPGLCHGSDLRSGMGQGGTGGSPPTSNPLSATAGPRHFSQTVDRPCWGTAVPAICQVICCTCTCLASACTTTAPQCKRGTVTQLSLARAPAHAILQQSRESQISLLPTYRIASHRIASHHAARTHPPSPTCCVVNAAHGRTACSLALVLGPLLHGLHSITSSPLCQQTPSWRVASLTTHLLTAPSTWLGEIMTDNPPRLG